MQLKRTASFQAISVVAALWTTAATAAPLTFTELFNPAEISNPKNVVAAIMNRVWRREIEEITGASYEFMYSSFEANGNTYLVSMMSSPLCGANACSWSVQRVTPDFKVIDSTEKINACADRNTVDVADGKLSICGKPVELP
jgi:hypothetical protein